MTDRFGLTTIALLSASLIVGACGSDSDSSDATSAASNASSEGNPMDSGDPPDMSDPPRADLGVTPPAACGPYCDALSQCLGEASEDCLLRCATSYAQNETTSDGCLSSYETLLGCVAGLSCDDVGNHQAGAGPCIDEDAAVVTACSDLTPPAVCTAFCQTSEMCGGPASDECLTLCAESMAAAQEQAAACGTAQEAVLQCAATLACTDFDAWTAGEGDYPCRMADLDLATNCESN